MTQKLPYIAIVESLQHRISQLQQELDQADQSELCRILLEIASLQADISPAESRSTAERALVIGQQLKDPILEATAYIRIGKAIYATMNFSEALQYHMLALDLAERASDDRLVISATQNITACQVHIHKTEVQEESLRSCLQKDLEDAAWEDAAEALNYLAALHLDTDFSKASIYYLNG